MRHVRTHPLAGAPAALRCAGLLLLPALGPAAPVAAAEPVQEAVAIERPPVAGGGREEPAEFPGWNVVLIVLDDLGIDKLALYEDELAPRSVPPACGVDPPPGLKRFPCTPNLEALRDAGLLFANAYAHPSCTPTRASILTGRYPFRTGAGVAVDDQIVCGDGVPCDGPEALSDDELLLPELVRDAPEAGAYAIARGAFGKWHLTYVAGDECHPVRNGFEVYQGNMGNGNFSPVGPDHYSWRFVWSETDGDGGCRLVDVVRTDDVRTCGPDSTWDAAVTRRQARRWIDAQVASRRPYFAYVGFNPPHGVQQVPPLCDLSAETVDRLAALGLAQAGLLAEESELGTVEERSLAVYDATIEALDAEIGRLLDGLDNTMVVVVGDNGTPDRLLDIDPTPYPTCRGKRSVYELGVRVPLLVAGPLIDPAHAGQTVEGLVEAVDLFRTVLNLLGLSDREIDGYLALDPSPPVVDSLSFLPLLIDPEGPAPRTRAYSEVFFPNAGGGRPLEPITWLRAVTDGEFKLVQKLFDAEWVDGERVAGDVVEELFHLAVDPWETDPLCAPPPAASACASGCPPPACAAPSHPSCGVPGCTVAACCARACPPQPGTPAFDAYLRLRRALAALDASR